MGCTVSKDAVETIRKSRSAQIGRGMSMPVQAQGNRDNGYHMVALTSSTYGTLKVEDPKINDNSVSLSDSSHDAFYEKLRNFDVPDEMVAKSWSEVSRNLPRIPPPTRTDSPRRTDSLQRMDSPRLHSRGMDSPRRMDSPRLYSRGIDSPRRMDSPRLHSRGIDSPRRMDSPRLHSRGVDMGSPRLQTRGIDSPRQMGSFRGMDSPRQRGSIRRTDSPRRLPSQATKSDHDTINTWELMDGLDEDGNAFAKPKLKPVERIPGSPVIRPFERSITFSSIHTLSELDSGDPSMAIAHGPAGNFLNSSNSVDSGGKENTIPVRAMTRSASSPIVPKWDEISVRLTPSSPSLVARVAAPTSDSPRLRQSTIPPMMLTPEANATIQEISNAVSKSLLFPPSPSQRSIGIKKSSDSPQPTVAAMMVAPGVDEALQEGSHAVSKSHLPPPSPLLRSVGTKNTSVTQVRNRPPGSKSPMVKAVDSPMSLNTKLEAEIERAISEERGGSGRQSFSKQPAAMTSMEPDAGRVRAVAASLSQEGAVARPRPTPRQVEVDETSNRPNREVPRFASPIHVLSLAASFDLENRKNSMSHFDPKAPPGQSGGKSFSKQQSMPSSSLRAIPSSGQGVGLRSQASAPSHGRHGSLDTLNVRVGSQKDSSLLDSDLLASFEEALEMLSTDEQLNVRSSKGEATSISGIIDSNRPAPMDTNGMSFNGPEGVSGDKSRQGNGNKGANASLAAHGEAILSTSSAAKGTTPRKIVKPDPWARFELKCPPAGEDRVVLYTTSLRGIRKTFEDCNNARFIFESFNIDIDERDVSIHAEFRQELKELAEKPVPVPQVFIKGRYIGGMDIITQLHEDGTLATLVDGLPPQLSRGECDGCGGVRFVPCSDCSGSTKVLNEAKEVVRCSECNENGLMRCPICY